MPQYFKNHDYTVLGSGKVYHGGKPPNNDEPLSWSSDKPYVPPSFDKCQPWNFFCPYAADDISKAKADDTRMVQAAISHLKYAVGKGSPFAIFLGLHYPHQPWHTPSFAVDPYRNRTDLHLPKHPFSPIGVPDVAFTNEMDGRGTLSLPENVCKFTQPPMANKSLVCPKKKKAGAEAEANSIHGNNVSSLPSPPPSSSYLSSYSYPLPSPGKNTIPDWFAYQSRIGYYSAVTLTDFHVGLMLDALTDQGVDNSTIVVFTADHGYQLGCV